MTRTAPTIDNKQKLLRVLSYLNGTKTMYRIIGTNGLDYLQIWINTSYAVHGDMRGHIEGVLNMGKGVIIHGCSKQKLITKSSTKTEIIGVSDFLPYTMWASYFLKVQ